MLRHLLKRFTSLSFVQIYEVSASSLNNLESLHFSAEDGQGDRLAFCVFLDEIPVSTVAIQTEALSYIVGMCDEALDVFKTLVARGAVGDEESILDACLSPLQEIYDIIAEVTFRSYDDASWLYMAVREDDLN